MYLTCLTQSTSNKVISSIQRFKVFSVRRVRFEHHAPLRISLTSGQRYEPRQNLIFYLLEYPSDLAKDFPFTDCPANNSYLTEIL